MDNNYDKFLELSEFDSDTGFTADDDMIYSRSSTGKIGYVYSTDDDQVEDLLDLIE